MSCTTYGFGPPSAFRQTSPCSWQARFGFGSDTYYVRAIHTRFPYGSILSDLACSLYQLVGSFFNRHAVTARTFYTFIYFCFVRWTRRRWNAASGQKWKFSRAGLVLESSNSIANFVLTTVGRSQLVVAYITHLNSRSFHLTKQK